jgi:hypothetical protein
MHLAQALVADEGSLPMVQHTIYSFSPILGISLTNEKIGQRGQGDALILTTKFTSG